MKRRGKNMVIHKSLIIKLFFSVFFLVEPGGAKAQVDIWDIVSHPIKEDTIELTATDLENCVISFESHDGTLQTGVKTVKYYDDFGRLKETVLTGVSPSRKDMVSYIDYDNAGRLFRTWLPGASDNSDGSFVMRDQAVSRSSVTNADVAPYSMMLYESSPLDRVMHQFGAGTVWHDNMKSIKTDFIINVENENHLNVLSLRIVDGTGDAVSIVVDGNLPSGTLQGVKTTDEESNERYEFKDLWDNTVLSRAIVDGEEYDTYYVYDAMGKLRAVLPPAIMEGIAIGKIDADLVNQYAYLYRYDKQFRLAGKKLPGCEWQHMFYDNADRLVFSQDGNQRDRNEFSFYVYDAIGRECIRGVFTPHGAIGNVSGYVKCTFKGTNSLWKGYDVSGISINSPFIMSVNYYDNYDFISLSSVTTWPAEKIPLFDSLDIQPNAQGLLTGCITAICTNNVENSNLEYLYKAVYYDNRSRIVHTEETNILGGIDTENLCLSFTGIPLQRTHVQTRGSQWAMTEVYTYSYDHAQRIKDVKHRLNDNDERIIAHYDYDDLGRVSLKTLGNGVSIRYNYNARGWLSMLGSSKFHESLEYNYNGNISAQSWLTTSSCPDGYYNFSYDNLSRLTNAQWTNPDSEYDYSVDYSYDKMGNILTLQRRGMQKTADGEDYACSVDDLSMNYDGNHLIRVSDDHYSLDDKRIYDFWDGADETVEYYYDSNGNMTQDLNKGISQIKYSHQNLPLCISFPDDSVKYSYSFSGEKLSSTYYKTIYKGPVPLKPGLTSPHPPLRPVLLIRNTAYCKNFTYNTPELVRIDIDGGYISFSNRSDVPVYHYYIQDHLGSNRMVLSENGEIEQEMHYYPFGGILGESNDGNDQRYRYNGKEYESLGGLNLHDYGARYYDQTLGRWHVMDEMAEKYYNISPYAYCANNPLKYVDIGGKDGVISIYGNNIIISSNIFLYGEGATKSVLKQMQNDVNTIWGNNYAIKHNGTTYNVCFNINMSLYADEEKSNPVFIPDAWNPYSRNNYIKVTDDDRRSGVYGSDEGVWRSRGRNGKSLSDDDPAPHEIGHILGLHDQYTDKNGIKKGWEKNIMGDSKGGKVDNRNIKDILKDVWQEYDKWINDGNNGVFKYEINP